MSPRRPTDLSIVARIGADAGAAAIVSSSAMLAKLQTHLQSDPYFSGVLLLSFEDQSVGSTVDKAEDESPDSVAYLQYTSGSSGVAKGVAVTHRNVLSNLRLLRDTFGHKSGTTIVSWLPHYHDMGLVGTLLYPLFLGSHCVFMSPESFLQEPSRWLRAIARYGAQASAAPTFGYQLCCDRIGQLDDNLDLSRWTTAIAGAESVRTRTLRLFANKFSAHGFSVSSLCPSYGLAEATLFVSGGPWRPGLEVNGTAACGLLREQNVRVVNSQARMICQEGEIGEIWVRGASVAHKYWNSPEETSQRFGASLVDGEGPYLRTQDLGMSKDGYLFIVGRMSNVIIVRGRKLFAEEIEEAISGCHPDIVGSKAAVFALHANGDEHEQIVLFQEVQRKALKHLDLNCEGVFQALQHTLGEKLQIRADHIALLRPGYIPRTTSGKVRLPACRSAFLAGTLKVIAKYELGHAEVSTTQGGPPIFSHVTEIERWLTERIARQLRRNAEEISTSDSFGALGLTSVEVIGITEELAVAIGAPLEPTLFWECPSIEAVVRQVNANSVAT
jgi:myxalamid-type polyketide synthase MxaB